MITTIKAVPKETILTFEVTTELKEGIKKEVLTQGRYLIGSSPFCHIRIPLPSTEISLALIIHHRGAYLKSLTDKTPITIRGKRLKSGGEHIIGEKLRFLVYDIPIHIHMVVKKNEISQATNEKNNLEKTQLAAMHELIDSLSLQNMSNLERFQYAQKDRANLILDKILKEKLSPDTDEKNHALETLHAKIIDEVFGLGAIEPLLKDETISEIMVNHQGQIYTEQKGKIQLTPLSFSSDDALMNVIERIVSACGRRIDTLSPIVDARLKDGSRVNAIIPPLALKGPCLTIRRFSKTPLSVDNLISFGSMNEAMAKLLKILVEERINILISGGTGSGKTTLLNVLSRFIPEDERIVTVEDAAELQLQQTHVVSLETRPANLEGVGAITIRDLVKNTLRMRPDRIIVGECRGGEALDMLQAMNTGHDGSMTTGHANSPEDMLRRLETMVLMAGMDLPLIAIREQISSAVDIIVQQTRMKDGQRLITNIAWVRGFHRHENRYDVVEILKAKKPGEFIFVEDALQELYRVKEIKL